MNRNRRAGWVRPLGRIAFCLFALSLITLQAENWPQWRGPFLNGSTTETNLPTTWTRTDKVAWVTPLPGKSGATPIVWKDSLFLPSPDPEQRLWLFCLEASDGKVRWKQQVAQGDRTTAKNNMASCSAVTDGQSVYALFGTSDFAAFDFSGKQLWHTRLADEFGDFACLFQYGASPLLHDGKLYVPILQRNAPPQEGKPGRQSWLVCVDPASGRTLWKWERKTDAVEESMDAYTTPIPLQSAEGTEIILVGANAVTGHRPDNGEELWRYPGINAKRTGYGRIVPTPVTAPGLIFAVGPKRETLVALRAGARRTLDAHEVAWRTDQFVPDVCTPLFYLGKLFVLDGDRQTLTCYQPDTGQKLWQGKLGVREIFSTSPTGADGRIYCMSDESTIVILSAGETFRILATIQMDEGPSMSSVVAAEGHLFIRTSRNLYCIAR